MLAPLPAWAWKPGPLAHPQEEASLDRLSQSVGVVEGVTPSASCISPQSLPSLPAESTAATLCFWEQELCCILVSLECSAQVLSRIQLIWHSCRAYKQDPTLRINLPGLCWPVASCWSSVCLWIAFMKLLSLQWLLQTAAHARWMLNACLMGLPK